MEDAGTAGEASLEEELARLRARCAALEAVAAEGDAPDVYLATRPVAITSQLDRASPWVAELTPGEAFEVVEVQHVVQEQRVRGRVETPAGWVSILATGEDSLRWALRVGDGTGLEELRDACGASRARILELEAEGEELRGRVVELEAALSQMRAAVPAGGESAAELEGLASRQRVRIAELEAAAARADDLEEQLSRQRDANADLEDRLVRVSELEEQGSADLDERLRRVAELEAQVAKRAREVELQMAREREESAVAQQEAIARAEALCRQVARLEAECEQRDALLGALQSEREELLAKVSVQERQLCDLARPEAERATPGAAEAEALAVQVRTLEAQVNDLTEQLIAASAAEGAPRELGPRAGFVQVLDTAVERERFRESLAGKRVLHVKGFGSGRREPSEVDASQEKEALQVLSGFSPDFLVVDGDPWGSGFQLYVKALVDSMRASGSTAPRVIWAKHVAQLLEDGTVADASERAKRLEKAQGWADQGISVIVMWLASREIEIKIDDMFGPGTFAKLEPLDHSTRGGVRILSEASPKWWLGVESTLKRAIVDVEQRRDMQYFEKCSFENVAKGNTIFDALHNPACSSHGVASLGGGESVLLELGSVYLNSGSGFDRSRAAVLPFGRGRDTDPRLPRHVGAAFLGGGLREAAARAGELEAEGARLRRRAQELEAERGALLERAERDAGRLAAQAAECDGLRRECERLRSPAGPPDDAASEVDGLQAQLRGLEEERAELARANSSLQARAESLRLVCAEQQDELSGAREEVRAEAARQQEELVRLRDELAGAQGARADAERLRAEVAALVAQRQETQEQAEGQGRLAAEVAELRAQNRSLARAGEALSLDVSRLREDAEELEAARRALAVEVEEHRRLAEQSAEERGVIDAEAARLRAENLVWKTENDDLLARMQELALPRSPLPALEEGEARLALTAAEHWVLYHPAPPLEQSPESMCYLGRHTVRLHGLAGQAQLSASPAMVSWRRGERVGWAADLVEGGAFARAALQAYRVHDTDRQGFLRWSDGAVQDFIVAVFSQHALAPPPEPLVAEACACFMPDKADRLPAAECLCLADALLRALLLAARGDAGTGGCGAAAAALVAPGAGGGAHARGPPAAAAWPAAPAPAAGGVALGAGGGDGSAAHAPAVGEVAGGLGRGSSASSLERLPDVGEAPQPPDEQELRDASWGASASSVGAGGFLDPSLPARLQARLTEAERAAERALEALTHEPARARSPARAAPLSSGGACSANGLAGTTYAAPASAQSLGGLSAGGLPGASGPPPVAAVPGRPAGAPPLAGGGCLVGVPGGGFCAPAPAPACGAAGPPSAPQALHLPEPVAAGGAYFPPAR